MILCIVDGGDNELQLHVLQQSHVSLPSPDWVVGHLMLNKIFKIKIKFKIKSNKIKIKIK